jgi:type IV pilus assembly protein PilY1
MNAPRHLAKKALIAYLIYAVGFSPLMVPAAQAATSDYSDVPLPAKKRPNPNLILAIDDSGSMDGELAIDANDGAGWYYTAGLTVGSALVDGKTRPGFHGLNQNDKQDNVKNPPNFNNAGNANGTWKKYTYLFPNGVCGTNCDTRAYADDQNDHFAVSPSQQFGFYRSPDFNKQYYNPTIVYQPWKPYGAETGGDQTCKSGTVTGGGATWLCTPGNADPQGALSHPIYDGSKYNLTSDISDNTNAGHYFRLYDGMRVLPEAKYRRCRGAADNDNCEGWQTAPAGSLLCVGGDNANAKAVCDLGSTTSGNIPMTVGATQYDHVDMAPKYFPARYFISTTSAKVDPALYTGFPIMAGAGPGGEQMRMVEIRPATPNFPKAASRTDCSGATCTYAEEIQNFANWFQYYRKRHMSLNGALGNSFDGLNALRAGYFLFNNRFDVKMYDFDVVGQFDKNERALLSKLYRVKGNGGTPTRESLEHMGRQYTRTGANAPVTAPCQFNGGFVITDGFATSGGPGGYGNADNVAPGVNAFTKQFKEDPAIVLQDPYRDTWSNTMADVALYFYSTNIRPDLPAGRVSVDPNDLNPDADKNKNLHMNTYGLVLGLSGMIFQNPNAPGPTQTADPYNNPPNWNAVNPTAQQRSPTAIDELWHATINGRGQMLKADSPEETRNAVLDVVNNVVAKGGGAAAVSVSNAIPTAGDNFTYQTSYNAGAWAGDINAFTIDILTGALSTTPAWTLSAQKQLADRNWTSRVIVTYDQNAVPSAKGIPLRWADLTGAQQTALTGLKIGPTNVPGAWVVDWLRGDRSREGQFLRSRGPRKDPLTGLWKDGIIPNNVSVLGDLVNAEPLYVREPRFNYFDAGYASFKATNAGRTRVLYVAGNDGLVHVFDGTTGAEKWAYAPSFGFTPQGGFTTAGLRNLADKEFFIHRFLVDATPYAGDFDTVTAGTPTGATPLDGSSWKSIVIGGLGKGGRGFYAIDATNPDASDELGAASRIMWEFPNASTPNATAQNVGYAYGRPLLVRTRALGWVVLVTSGYENGNETGGDGRGHLFVLNPLTGAVLADLTTVDSQDGALNAADRRANPRGLAFISAFAGSAFTDPTIESVYSGDLYGNVWRFDLSGLTVGDWKVRKLATLTDASGQRQPITSEPELATVGASRVIYVGTGRYYGDKDIPGVAGAFVSATGKQSMYALKDDLSDAPLIVAPRSDLVQQVITKSGTFAQITSNPVDFNTKKGWYVDFPDTGERIITNPTLAVGVLSFTTNIPDGTDPCLPGGRSWLYAIDFRTGSFVPGATYAGRFFANALASRVNTIRVGTGLKGLIRTSEGKTEVADEPGRTGLVGAKRKSWREVIVR